MVKELDAQLTTSWEAYVQLHKDLEVYANRDLQGEELEAANKILVNIQESFKEIYQVFLFIGTKLEFAQKASADYSAFIDNIKKANTPKEITN
jgi:hypothetical protein